jgi:hypothetical protein
MREKTSADSTREKGREARDATPHSSSSPTISRSRRGYQSHVNEVREVTLEIDVN